jgi:hypothetical protein
MGRAEGGDQADARGVAPDKDGGAGHHVAVGARRDADTVVTGGGIFEHALEPLEGQVRVAQAMGQIQDRVVGLLPVDAVQFQPLARFELVEHHLAGLAHWGQLGRVAEQDQRREDLLQIVELALVEHGAFVDQPDIQRAVAALPAGDEIRPAQPGGGERSGHRFRRLVDRPRPVERGIGQGLDHRAFALACQPFRDLLVFRVVDRGVEDAVDRGRRDATGAQDTRRLVGGGKDRHGAPVLAAAAFPIARDDLDACAFQRAHQFGQQERLARPRLADHRKDVGLPVRHGRDGAPVEIHAKAPQALGDAVMGLGLFVGEGECLRRHAPDPSRPHAGAREGLVRQKARAARPRPFACRPS